MKTDFVNKTIGKAVIIFVKVELLIWKLYLKITAKTNENAHINKSNIKITQRGKFELVANSKRNISY